MGLFLFVLGIYEMVVLARVVSSWVHADPSHPVVRWVYLVTEPVLEPIRRLLPAAGIGIDFSPIVVFLIIALLRRLLGAGSLF